MKPGSFQVYAIRCGKDGAIERHRTSRWTMRNLVELEAQRLDQHGGRRCAPHLVVTATITMTDWAPTEPDFVGPNDDEREAGERIKAGALRHPCPKCGVTAGVPCENLTERRKGRTVPTSWPHRERVDLWNQEPPAEDDGFDAAEEPMYCPGCGTLLDDDQPEDSCCNWSPWDEA